MNGRGIPVVLVHGWNSHPGIWNRLAARLDDAGIGFQRFDHTKMAGMPLPEIAGALGDFIGSAREETGYHGTVDIVCHSVGTCIARYLLEVIDGRERQQQVRQLIGLGPPNNGSALAELFSHPVYGSGIIDQLTGIFVPKGFDPAIDPLVQDVRPESPVMRELRSAGIRKDICYRVIVTANPDGIPAFFPWFSGKTYEITLGGTVQMTRDGDGIVPHTESALPGVSLDVLPAGNGTAVPLPSPDQYCHISLPRNPVVIDRVMEYLTQPVDNKSPQKP